MSRLLSLFCLICLVLLAAQSSVVRADHTETPDLVVVPGTIQSVLGCDEDWRPDCEATALTYDETHDLWLGTFSLPAGSYEYKVAINGTWDEDYGANAEQGGANIKLEVEAQTDITFIYDHKSHYVADTVNRFLAVMVGSFSAEIGCPDTSFDDPSNPGDWAPDCYRTLLQDPDGDGIYTFTTNDIPAGNYEGKVALNGNWGENYGDQGAAGGANIAFTVPKDNADVLFSWNGDTKVLTVNAEGAPKGNLGELAAYWVSADTILTPQDPDQTFILNYSPDASLTIGEDGLSGGEEFELAVVDSADSSVYQKFPHLSQLTVLRLPTGAISRVGELLQGQIALEVLGADGAPVTATGLQIPGVLDELYTTDGDLGVTWDGDSPTVALWAPTAQSVNLHLFDDASPDTAASDIIQMERSDLGVWSISGRSDWKGKFYLFEISLYVPKEQAIVTNVVTDPYSLSLATNSTRSHMIDLRDAIHQPDGWQTLAKPGIAAPEDIVLYELHLRDFSIIDESVPEAHRGTYMAFTHPEANGMQHLAALAAAGLTHIHMLPLFDIATIEEDRDAQSAPLARYLANFPTDSDQQQQAIFNLRDADGFNWGYDPYHYTTPEGSYATSADGAQRVLEFRQMVQALNQTGLRMVMDVVYNHTNAGGQDGRSVLDRIVPGYYHRLSSKGNIENSTCCSNTATEHNMMRKLMIDSLLVWAVDYKVDGFRFDLMGHHMVSDMQAVRDALDSLTLEEHGVDGKSIYVYGEGWNFGEVANGIRGENATQLNVGGLGIGTFNDRIRDAVRGGNPFGGEQEQGFATGLFTNPNGTDQGPDGLQKARLLLFADQIRVGLAGNLSDYEFMSSSNATVIGNQVDYNGSPTGYTLDPQEHINYASAHDNETLFDAVQFKVPIDTSMADRVRYQNFALDLVMYGQGVPFFHAGSDMLRSKSMDRDSYNSGDWFNAIDFTYASTNWGAGLPVADKNEAKWELIQPLLANESLNPDQAAVLANVSHFREALAIRASSPLFRLQTAEEVQNRLTFHNTGQDQIPGLIVMSIADEDSAEKLDPNYDNIVVFFNGTTETQSFTLDGIGPMELHPVLLDSADSIVQSAAVDGNNTFSVPALTTAVFVQPNPNAPVDTIRTSDVGLVEVPIMEVEEESVEAAVDETETENESANSDPETNEASPEDDDGGSNVAVWIGAGTAIAAGVGVAIASSRKNSAENQSNT